MEKTYKKLFEDDGNKINKYSITFTVRQGKIYIDEDVDAKDTKTKTEFLKRVSSFTDDIQTLIEDFNS